MIIDITNFVDLAKSTLDTHIYNHIYTYTFHLLCLGYIVKQ